MEATDKAGERGPNEGAKVSVPAPPPAEVDDAPDPDEDDLDDLDDMLDDFSNTNLSNPPQPQHSGPPPKASATGASGGPAAAAAIPPLDTDVPGADGDEFSEEEFQKQLQAGMAELMQDLETSPEMQAQFEHIFKGLGDAMGAGEGSSAGDKAKGTAPASPGPEAKAAAGKAAADLNQDASFQDTIKRTMAQMQESGDQATAEATAGGEDDLIAGMMRAMQDLPGAGGEGGGDEDFSKMLMGMMEQLTNKEILYEPMKELSDKFPDWMRQHSASLSAEDRERYSTQQTLVTEMVARFEKPSYSDSNAADREYIVDRMQKMQAAGSPPTDLVGDMPSAKEVLDGPDLDEGCPQQ